MIYAPCFFERTAAHATQNPAQGFWVFMNKSRKFRQSLYIFFSPKIWDKRAHGGSANLLPTSKRVSLRSSRLFKIRVKNVENTLFCGPPIFVLFSLKRNSRTFFFFYRRKVHHSLFSHFKSQTKLGKASPRRLKVPVFCYHILLFNLASCQYDLILFYSYNTAPPFTLDRSSKHAICK